MRTFVLRILLITTLISLSCKKKKNDPEGQNFTAPYFLLSGDAFSKLRVDIQYVEGFAPSAQTLANIKTFMAQRMNKPNGIEFITRAIPSGQNSTYSLDEIRAIEKDYRSTKTENKTITAYFIFLDKDYSGNTNNSSKVLGIHYGTTSIVVFENVIRQFSGDLTQPKVSDLETAVTEHEIGHMMGLTNHGTPMKTDHEDKDHSAHCSNTKCLMYYTSETSDIVANLIGNTVPILDANCLNDLQANGGK